MKPRTATTITVVLLLAGSVFSIGWRLNTDASHAGAATGKGDTTDALADGRSGPPRSPRSPREDGALPLTLAARVENACALPVAAARLRALLELAAGMKGDDWRIALEALQGTQLREDGPERDALLGAWAEADPLAALAWAESGKKEDSSSMHRRDETVIEAWTRSRPDEALAWLLAQDSVAEHTRWGRFMNAVIAGLEGDLDRIGKALTEIPDVGNKMWVAGQMTRLFDGVPPDHARDWLAGLEPTLREWSINSAFNHYTGYQDRLELLKGLPEENSGRFRFRLYFEWTQADPAGAMAALGEIENGEQRTQAVSAIANGLKVLDRMEDALDLLDRYPENVPDDLVTDLSRAAQPQDIERVLGYSLRIGNPIKKQDSLRTLLDRWSETDPEAAGTWVESHPDVPEILRTKYPASLKVWRDDEMH